MSKQRALCFIFIALFVGMVAGGGPFAGFFGHFSRNLLSSSAAADVGSSVGILTMIRKGDTTNPIELLEIKLDGALIGLGASLAELPVAERDPAQIRTLQRARDYRFTYPRTNPSVEIEAGIARAFHLLNEKRQ